MNLYYCSECMHVYFRLPSDQKCAICHNEMNEKDLISDASLDIFTCETCHSLYTIQNIDEIIPKDVENKNYLCACKHHCPTNALLQIGKEEAYIGNIVLTDIFKCTNCGAISYRNPDNQRRDCSECSSRFVIPLYWDPQTQKTFFQCANKQSHGIRLKLRDLILNNNQIISEEIAKIKLKEQQLQKEYYQLREQAMKKYEDKGFIKKLTKNKKDLEEKLKQLNIWAIEERRKLFRHLRPIGLRCAVYRMKKENNQILYEKTKDGCGAISLLKIRKIIFAPDGTIIDRAPPKPEEPDIIEEKKEHHQIPINELNSALCLTPMESLVSQIAPIKKEEQEIEIDSMESLIPYEEIFKTLPALQEDQLYVKIELLAQKFLSNSCHRINSGVIPIQIGENNNDIKIGREHVIRAYWSNPEFFKDQPFLFNNITPMSKNSNQFRLQKRSDGYYVLPGENIINKSYFSSKDSSDDVKYELIEPIALNKIDHIIFNTYYSFDKERAGMNHQFIFNISIDLPKLEIKT